MLRINLLRHLPAPEAAVAKTPRGGAWKRALGVLLALALVAAAAWVLRHPEWRPKLPSIAEIVPKKKAEAPAAPAVDSARLALEARAMAEIAAHQAASARLSRALDSVLSGGNKTLPAPTRAVLTAPNGFVLRGEAASAAALRRLRDFLSADSALSLLREDSRPGEGGRGLEFILSGTMAGIADSSPTSALPALPADPAALDRAWAAFLEDAARAGIELTVLPAGAPTGSGNLQARPYRAAAKCSPHELRDFLESDAVRASPFAVRRITWENDATARMVSLDIMSFSPR